MWLFQRLSAGACCSCGKNLEKCGIWGEVANLMEQNIGITWAEASRISLRNDVSPFRVRPCSQYKRLWRSAIQAIQVATGKSILVDSSKSNHIGWRRINNLQLVLDQQVKVIHLVRDPRAVMWSMSRGRNKNLAKSEASRSLPRGLGAVLSWRLSNSLSEYAVTRRRCDSVLLRYEDLVQDPVKTFDTLERLLGIDLGDLSSKLSRNCPMRTGHGVDGNRMRNKATFIMQNDEVWKEMLSRPAIRCAEILAGQKLIRYGYSRLAD